MEKKGPEGDIGAAAKGSELRTYDWEEEEGGRLRWIAEDAGSSDISPCCSASQSSRAGRKVCI